MCEGPGVTISHGELHDLVGLCAPVEPTEIWVSEGWHWPFGEDHKLPTFTRSIPRRRPPPRPAGLYRCLPHEVERWERDSFRYPPYTYRDECCLRNSSGDFRVLQGSEREVLSGFFPGHTAPFSESDPGNSEDIRCAQIGNTFQCGVVAWLLGQGLEAAGLIPHAPSPDEIQTSFYAEVARRLSHELPTQISLVQSMDGSGEGVPTLPKPSASPTASLPEALVHGLLRRADHRGADVRLDLGIPFRPSAWPRSEINIERWKWRTVLAFPWNGPQMHINEYELLTVLQGIKWRCRAKRRLGRRFCVLVDSQVTLSVAAKGRSSSFRLNRILRRLDAYVLASFSLPFYGYVSSGKNPADKPSRKKWRPR